MFNRKVSKSSVFLWPAVRRNIRSVNQMERRRKEVLISDITELFRGSPAVGF